jgi:uncharacterized membrane protein YidH (DUF202 family)
LEEIGTQIDAKSFWSGLRGYKEWIMVCAILTIPLVAYEAWQWKRKGKTIKKKADLINIIIAITVPAALVSLLLLIQLCY